MKLDSFKKGQVLLVDNLRGYQHAGKCIIHVRKVDTWSLSYRLISTRKGMCTFKESQTTSTLEFKDLDVVTKVISDLDIDLNALELTTYKELKAHIADLYPEYFI